MGRMSLFKERFGMTPEQMRVYAKDKDLDDISKEFKLPFNIVKTSFYNNSIYCKRLHRVAKRRNYRNEEILNLYKTMTQTEIAAKFNISRQRVSQIIRDELCDIQ